MIAVNVVSMTLLITDLTERWTIKIHAEIVVELLYMCQIKFLKM